MEAALNNAESDSMNAFWEVLDLPKSCYLGSRITKKLLLKNEYLKAASKKLITEDIERVQWEYTLKPETINIAPFQSDDLDYGEIAILRADLRNPKRASRLAELLQRIIPYPLVLVLTYKNQLRISLALKRQNHADQQKLTVESFLDTEWLPIEDNGEDREEDNNVPTIAFYKSLECKQFNWNNFYTFYLSWVKRVLAIQSGQITGQFHLRKEPLSAEVLLSTHKKITEYHRLQKESVTLRQQAAKVQQISKQIELNTQLRQLQQRVDSLKKDLSVSVDRALSL